MKTFIIQLESHDDLDSTRDKLKGAKARRAILVWPKSGKAVADFYSLSLLQREAKRQGLAIGFISSLAEVRENANILGIPVFESLSQAERSVWSTPVRPHIDRKAPQGYQYLAAERERLYPQRKNTRLHEFGRAMLFLVSILSLAVLVLFFTPSAAVKIAPHKTEQSISFDVRVNPSANEVNLAGVIPGQTVRLELSGTQTGTSSGQTRVGSASASGELQLTNLSGQVLDIPAGTSFITLSNESLRFSTVESVRLAADNTKSYSVKVTANQAGEEGNLPAGESFVSQTAWAGSVTASNAEAFTGGTSIDSPSPSEADLEKNRQALIQNLEEQAGNTLLIGRPEGTVLIPQSLDGSVISEVRSAEAGQPADHFTLEIKMAFAATTYLQSDVDELAQSILDANLGSGMKAVPGSLEVNSLTEIANQEGNYSWKVKARRLSEAQISMDDLSQAVVRMPLEQAKAYFDSSLQLDQNAEINITPHWWKYMPFVSFRIQIEEQ